MRKIMLFIVVIFLLLNIINIDAKEFKKSNFFIDKESIDTNLPDWKLGDFWNYYIKLDGNPDASTKVDIIINNLNVEIVDVNATIFKLQINGGIQGRVSAGEISGNFKDTSIEGFLSIVKNNLSVDYVDANIIGKLTVALIPIPFDVDIDINCSPSFNSVQFPIFVGKEWQVPLSRINGFINVSAVIDSIPVFLLAGGGISQCVSIENVSIDSGIYESYKIITNMDISEIYYSSILGNIIRMTGSNYDFENIFLELKTTNYVIPGAPLKPDSPDGETSGQKGVEYNYTASTYDYENDKIFYKFDWGDDTFSNWLGPFNNNETVLTSHIWYSDGSYSIRVKAKDDNSLESQWSDPLIVSMPKLKFYSYKKNIKSIFSIIN